MTKKLVKPSSAVGYRSTGTPLYFWGRVLCLMPFGKDYSQSPLASLCSLSVVAFILVTIYRFLVLFVELVIRKYIPLPMFLSGVALNLTAGISTIISTLWSALRARQDLKVIDASLDTIDKNLASIGVDRPSDSSKTTLILAVVNVFVMVLNSHDIVYYPGRLTETVLVRYLTYSTLIHTVVHFKTLVDALGLRYRRINTWLELEIGQASCAEIHVAEKKLHFANKPKRDGWFNLEEYRGRKCSKPLVAGTLATQLRRLRATHHIIHEVSIVVNTLFGLPMAGVVLYLLTSIVAFTFYFLTMTIIRNSDVLGSVAQPINMTITSFGWVAVHLGTLAAISRSAQKTMDEAKKTSWLIQRRAVHPSICPAYREELLRFSAQMLTTETVFSVCSIFRLDMTLLLSVAATITSYTIILLTS